MAGKNETPWWHKLRSRRLFVWVTSAVLFATGVLSEEGYLIVSGGYLGMQGWQDAVKSKYSRGGGA